MVCSDFGFYFGCQLWSSAKPIRSRTTRHDTKDDDENDGDDCEDDEEDVFVDNPTVTWIMCKDHHKNATLTADLFRECSDFGSSTPCIPTNITRTTTTRHDANKDDVDDDDDDENHDDYEDDEDDDILQGC